MRCKLKLTTTQEDYIPKELSAELKTTTQDMSENDAEILSNADSFTVYADGEILRDGEKIIIRYEEGDSAGLGSSVAELSFNRSAPKDINLARTGAVSVIMCFKEGFRHTCVYNTEVMPIELCIFTKQVDNRLFDLKYIEITYLIEIGGSCAQKTVMKMEIDTI
ncbi:MAG: DUF1934 domain-containing protein [Clostridia bacterium]|nr:DUF1934 domain-containing protein [Clostridia bacterium]